MQNRKPSRKIEKFIDEIVIGETSNTQAAINAGFSEKTAFVIASEYLKKPNIVARIEERKAECAKHANIRAAQVIGATALRAFATIDDAFDEDGNFSMAKARETGAVHLIKKLTRRPTKFGVDVSVEFYSNETAQDKLGNYLGLERAPQETNHKEVIFNFYKTMIQLNEPNALESALTAAKQLGFEVTEQEILAIDIEAKVIEPEVE